MNYRLIACAFGMLFATSHSALAAEKPVTVQNWQKLEIQGAFVTKLVSATDRRVVLIGNPKDFDKVKVQVKKDQLEIHHDRQKGPLENEVEVVIYSPDNEILREIDLEGSVKLNVEWTQLNGKDLEIQLDGASEFQAPTISADNIDLDQSGASKIRVSQIQARSLDLDSDGSSESILAGKADRLKIDVSGSSLMDLSQFSADEVKLDLSGSSQLSLGQTKLIQGEASGASQIKYLGEPKITLRTSGSSQIQSVVN